MSVTVLEAHGVWKRFDRSGTGAPTVRRLVRGGRSRDAFWALRDVTVELAAGEMLGLVGSNGSGKSTLLRLAGGVGRPTRGRIRAKREVGSVLTLGDSFDPLLTGRENAVTAAIVGGLSRRAACRMLDEVVEFAELEEFFDYPLRTYSDGMAVRLAFSVAMSIDPQILILDEVLAVGDARFQARCFDRLESLRDRGRTVLLASHDLAQIERLCDRVVWLSHGEVAARGTPDEVLEAYGEAMALETERRSAALSIVPQSGTSDESRFGTYEVEIANVAIVADRTATGLRSGVTLRIELAPARAVESPIVGVSLHRVRDGVKVLDVSTVGDGIDLGRVATAVEVELRLDRLDLEPGSYRFDVGVYERGWGAVYDYRWQAYPIEIAQDSGGFGPPRRWRVAKTP